MKPLTFCFLLLLLGGIGVSVQAHIGDKIYPIYELTDQDVNQINLDDGSIAEWEDFLGEPNFHAIDFIAHPDIGEGAPYNPDDLDYRIWLGWHQSFNRLYSAIERVDDIYINEWIGEELDQLWGYDSVELMVDGDHSGGEYIQGNCENTWSNCDGKLNRNRQAQHFFAIADSPNDRHIGYYGWGNEWATLPPYADGGGNSFGTRPTTSIIEFYVTPFDDLLYNDPENSQVSSLIHGKIIGFQISVPDFDTAPKEYKAFHTLSGQPASWRYAERFVDGHLVSAANHLTSVKNITWARIKCSLR